MEPKLARLALCTLLAIAILPAAGSGEGIELSETVSDAYTALEASLEMRFEQIAPTPTNDVDPQLINGRPVNPQLFPAILKMTFPFTCTSMLVGPTTVLIAAHCISGANAQFSIGGRTTRALCQQATTYNPVSHSDDAAICVLQHAVSGISFERVDLSTGVPNGTQVVVLGYGCTAENQPSDGVLRIGVTTIVPRPANVAFDPTVIYSESDISGGEAVLCPGDSGGPMFTTSGSLDTSRRLQGINSRTTFSRGVSMFTDLSSQNVSRFIRFAADQNGLKICGLNLDFPCK